MKVIFLDVDGVLNSEKFFIDNHIRGLLDEIDDFCVQLLKEIIDRTGAEIVLSSSWRVGAHSKNPFNPFPKLENALKKHGLKILDMTPVLNGTRGKEIKAWLSKHSVDKFVILDDESDMDDLLPHLVKTTFENGLTRVEVEKCVKMLNGDKQ